MNRDGLTDEPPAPFSAACRHIQRASGPGVTLYACPDCVVIVGVGAVADDVMGLPSTPPGLRPEEHG
ncbi:hypothetical protein ACVNF4_28910 [Streptomyces sp. S6]